MRGDTNFKGSDSSDPSVYSLFCGPVVNNIDILHITCVVLGNEIRTMRKFTSSEASPTFGHANANLNHYHYSVI